MRKAEINNRGLVTSQNVCIDKEYIEWLHELKTRFRSAQIKAAVKVNSEQLLFNWLLDRDLVIRKTEEKWGVESLTESVCTLETPHFDYTKGQKCRRSPVLYRKDNRGES